MEVHHLLCCGWNSPGTVVTCIAFEEGKCTLALKVNNGVLREIVHPCFTLKTKIICSEKFLRPNLRTWRVRTTSRIRHYVLQTRSTHLTNVFKGGDVFSRIIWLVVKPWSGFVPWQWAKQPHKMLTAFCDGLGFHPGEIACNSPFPSIRFMLQKL